MRTRRLTADALVKGRLFHDHGDSKDERDGDDDSDGAGGGGHGAGFSAHLQVLVETDALQSRCANITCQTRLKCQG